MPAVSDPQADTEDSLIGSSEPHAQVQKAIGLAADSDATVLILGETGTGKELVARALHVHGKRKDGPFVAVNCAAIPETCSRASCSAMSRAPSPARPPTAPAPSATPANGTLFLDEIGDMPLAMQAKILRALQEQVDHAGRRQAGAHRCARRRRHPSRSRQACRGGRFPRGPLLPAQRGADRNSAAARARGATSCRSPSTSSRCAAASGAGTSISAEAAIDKLQRHAWPGNVRELRNVIERACIMTRGERHRARRHRHQRKRDANGLAAASRCGSPRRRRATREDDDRSVRWTPAAAIVPRRRAVSTSTASCSTRRCSATASSRCQKS